MVQTRQVSLLGYWLTIILAMALTIIPWSIPTLNLTPDWVLLVLIYWALASPETASVGKAWFVGLLVDVLTTIVRAVRTCLYLEHLSEYQTA